MTLDALPCQLELPRAGARLRGDVEFKDRPTPWRARVRWTDPETGRRRSRSRSFSTEDAAWAWVETQRRAEDSRLDPATMRVLYEAARAAHAAGLLRDTTPGPCRVCTALEAAHRFIHDAPKAR